ncbi:MAG: hypothetical protein U0169_10125 [Polyangiaceae bacterium]
MMLAAFLAGASLAACMDSNSSDLEAEERDAAATSRRPSARPDPDAGFIVLSDGAVVPVGSVAAKSSEPFTEKEAISWIVANCANCHGVVREDGGTKLGVAYTSWGMDEDYSISSLETSNLTPVVYQTLYNRFVGQERPTPMPDPDVKATDYAHKVDKLAEIQRMLAFFQVRLPFAVAEADGRYKNPATTKSVIVNFSYSCQKYVSKRAFLTNFYAAVLDRLPRPAELAELGADPDQPVTPEDRKLVVGKLRTTLKSEFVGTETQPNSGLLKLARAIGGAPGIEANQELTTAQAADLKLEFYQALRAGYDTTDYKTFLTQNKVYVSATTASLYQGCTRPVSGWAECALPPPRAGFFTTRGFLASKRSSFLDANNNYGRVAQMYFAIFGEGLRPDTSGPTGGVAAPVPSCLEDADLRYVSNDPAAPGPIGLHAVAAQGAICQTCHITRSMAAGAVLFRPFSRNGGVYDTATFGSTAMLDKPSFDSATQANRWKITAPKQTATTGQPMPVPCATAGATNCDANRTPIAMEDFLKNTLLVPSLDAAGRKACVSTGDKSNPFLAVKDVGEFASFYLNQSSSAIARGFARHAHRAFANSNTITLEMANRLAEGFSNGKNKLPDLVEEYFLTETFACEPAAAGNADGGTQ